MSEPIHIECSIEEYHQRDEWSNSQISDYINRGPLFFFGAHVANPRLYPREEKAVWAFGSATHQLFSAPGHINEVAIEIPIDEFRTAKGEIPNSPLATTDYRKWAEEHAGKILLKPEDMRAARIMVRRVYEHPVASKLFSSAIHFEHTLIWQDDETGLGLRARPDILSGWRGSMIPSDFKTTRALSPREFARDARKFGYHRQAAWYSEPLRLLGYDVPGFYFIAVDKSPAHECRVYEMDSADIDAGLLEIREARRQIAERFAGNNPYDESSWMCSLDRQCLVISLPKWTDEWSLT